MNINSTIGYIEMSGQQALDMSMEYYIRVPLKLVTNVGFSKLFNKKEQANDNGTDKIQNQEDFKNSAFLNLKIMGTPDDYKISLGKNK
jgi:hypothetical protein